MYLLFGVGTSWAESSIEVISSISTSSTITIDNDAIKVGVMSITGTKGSSNAPVFNYNSTDGVDLRFYKGSSVTFAIAEGYKIESIVFNKTLDGSGTYTSANKNTFNNNLSTNVGTFKDGEWTAPLDGNTTSVTYSCGSTSNVTKLIYSITVTYSSVGSTPTPTSYSVIIANNIANGTVTASPTSAAAGTEVALTATPASGYEFGAWNVTNASTNAAITVTDNKFKMPAANVNVSATFNEIQSSTPDGTTSETYNFAAFTSGQDVTLNATNFTITLRKNAGTSNPAWVDGAKEARVYAKGSIEVTSTKNIVKIVYNYVVNANKNGVAPSVIGAAGANNPGSWDADAKTWDGSDKTVTLTTSGDAGNIGFKSITVYLEDSDEGGETPVEVMPIPNFIKTAALSLNVGDEAYDVRNCLNIPADYDADTYSITTTINGLTQKDGEFACVYPYLAFQKAGEYTVTVTAAAVPEKYAATTGTIKVTVKSDAPVELAGEGGGTEASPYDVTRALDYIAKKQDATVDVYVEGIISGIKSIDVSKYERAQYYISKDGSANSQLYIFNGYYLNGEKFTANDQIKVGDKVVVCGKLKDYSGTKEMDANNKIVKHEASTTPVKVTPTLKFTPTAVTAYLDAKDEFTAPELSNEKNVAVTYSSSDTGVATVNASTGAVTIVAAGETTITASFAGDDEYNEASASYTLTVKATKPQGMAIVAEYNGAWYAAVPELSSKKLVAVEVAVIDGKVYYDGDKTIAWAYDEANGTFVTEDGKYLAKTGTGTDVTLSEESGSITWSVGTNGIVNTTTNDRVLIYRSGVGFGNYGGTNAGKSGYAAKSQVLPIGTAAELEAIAGAPVAIGSTGYATYSPIAYDVTIPSGVEVYYVDASTVSDDCVVLTKYEGTALKQGEGVILKNSGSCTFAKATVAAEAIEDNALVGVSSDVTLKANSSYLLANDGGSAAFLLCEAGTLSAGKAYLPANGAKAPSLSIVIDDATAIEGLAASKPHNLTTSTYNLAGQKVGVDYKGIVIVNGKKLIKK